MRRVLIRYRPGLRPPARVLRELARRYRDIRLMWEPNLRRWAMVQVRLGQRPWLVGFLQNPDGSFAHPTIANTVGVLRRAHWSNFQDRYAVERRLAEADRADNPVDKGRENLRQDMWREGAERIRRLYSPKLVVPR